MSSNQDNNNNKSNPNPSIISTIQNIECYNFQAGTFNNGLFIIEKDSISFVFRWIPYNASRRLLSIESEKPIQLVSSINLIRVVVETSYQYCEASLYCYNSDEPTIFRTTQNHINFSHQLAQIFTINSIFLGNPNWAYLTQLFFEPLTSESEPIIYFLPCYKGKFSFPVFLEGQFLQKIKEKVEKAQKLKEIESQASNSENIHNENKKYGPFKTLFNLTKLVPFNQKSRNGQDSFLSNFSHILQKFKIKNIDFFVPMTKSEFMLLESQGLSEQVIKKKILGQGLDCELRRELWPIYLSILPAFSDENYAKVYTARIEEYKHLKSQWMSLLPYQLAQSSELRSVFYTIGMDVKRTTIPNELISCLSSEEEEVANKKATFLFKVLLENILKAFAFWNNNLMYTQGINEIVVPFVCVELYDVINDFASDKNFSLDSPADFINSSEKLIEREALAFWCFVAFQEKSQNVLLENSMNNLMEIDLPEILEIIKNNSRDSFKFLKQHQLDSLSFFVSHFMLLFRRSFCELFVERIWDVIIIIDDFMNKNPNVALIRKKNFEYAFAASVMIFIIPLLKKKMEMNSDPQSENEILLLEIPEAIEKLPIEYLIRAALVIENDLPQKTPPRISTCYPYLAANELFSPAMLAEYNEISKLGLFA